MRRKFKILLIAFVISGASIFLFLTPRLSYVDEPTMRKRALQEWARRIAEFENETGRLPHSLYEAAWYKNGGPMKLKIMEPTLLFPDMQGMRDPNAFFNEVEYALLKHRQGWFVMELKPGRDYPRRLLIDDKGNIMELRKAKDP